MSTPALLISHLKKTYSNGFEALKGIHLRVEQGDFFALLGANGAGKSTTIGIISSLVNKTSGVVNIAGFDVHQQPALAKQQLGVVPQEFNFIMHETPYQIVTNAAAFFGVPRPIAKQRAEKYLKLVELWEKRHQLANRLSGGMKRRLMIARALMHEPTLLILDEPTAGVDIEIRQSMWRFLRQLNEQGKTIILTTHYLEEAENLCKKIAIIDQGEILVNTSMKELLDRPVCETFVLYLKHDITQVNLSDIEYRLIDQGILEVDLNDDQSISDVVKQLASQGIDVNRMRNKVNRLEHLFLQTLQRETI